MGMMYQEAFIGFIVSKEDEVDQNPISDASAEFVSDIKFILKNSSGEDDIISCFEHVDIEAVESIAPKLLEEFKTLINNDLIEIENPYHSYGDENIIFKFAELPPVVPTSNMNYAWDITDLQTLLSTMNETQKWIKENASPDLAMILLELVKLSFVSTSE